MPPDVVLLLVGDILPATAAQLVVTVGDVLPAGDALGVQEDLARLAVVALVGNDGVATFAALGGGLPLDLQAAVCADLVVTVIVDVSAILAQAGVVRALLAETGVLTECVVVLGAAGADVAGVATCAPVVAAVRAPVGLALGASVVVATRAVDPN
jgi:hypothetical protein